MPQDIQPPIARKIPKKLRKHKHVRIDEYYWLNDRENPEVIDYLNKENEYYEKSTAHTKDFQEQLYLEMKSRIKEDDSSVPYFYNGYYYITRFEKGGDYPIYSRKKESLSAEEEILFDCNVMAKGHSFFQLGSFSVSPDNRFASFGTDVIGRRIFTLGIKNLETGEILSDEIPGTTGNTVWANDSHTIFYTKQDETTLRSDRIFRHEMGAADDVLVYHEQDDTFHIEIGKTKSRKYLVIDCESTMTTESRFLNADDPKGKFEVFQARRRGLEYGISHYDGHFYIRTNKDKATNFKLMKTRETATSSRNWEEVIPHREDVLLEDIEIFNNFLVVEERAGGLDKIRIMPWNGETEYYLPFESETYTAAASVNPDFDTEILRYSYQSMATPSSVIDFNMRTKTKTVLKEQEVLGGKFKKEDYFEERIWAEARDGKRIPISLVYKKGLKKNSKNPLLLYSYGSYGITMEPYFSTTRLSLLDRGFVYAIAHIRGGEDMGRQWYEDGKLLKKMNTFTDFIDCSEYLIAEGYTSPQHLYAEGGSAGGLLMGVVVNIAPQLYNGVIAQVPFVDVVTTMLDDSIPLTTGEYDEWGNPNKKIFYEYMLSYSPYDNIKEQDYPNMYISTGLHDSQVQYWEPAKWVARLRTMKTDANQLFLNTNMEAGHGGASGRFEALRELAKEFSFFLTLEGIKK
ncbi:MAG TPA: S9 family peptidase [Flavobacterium sp.]|jgi:oligopeptidase B